MATGIPLVIARKRSYGLDGEVEIDQSTGYSKGAMYLNDLREGERIAIVDDVLSTGGTLEAVIEGVRRAKANVTDIIAVVEKGEGLKRLQSLYPDIRIQSLVRLVMDGEIPSFSLMNERPVRMGGFMRERPRPAVRGSMDLDRHDFELDELMERIRANDNRLIAFSA